MVDADPKQLRDELTRVTDLLEPFVEVTYRAMFGGFGAYAEGRVFASLSNVGLALKLPPDAQDELLAVPGAARLKYEPDAPESKHYIVVPDTVRSDPATFAQWTKRSVEYVRTLPAPKPKARAAKP